MPYVRCARCNKLIDEKHTTEMLTLFSFSSKFCPPCYANDKAIIDAAKGKGAPTLHGIPDFGGPLDSVG